MTLKRAISGVIVIDKPPGPTSHTIVALARKVLQTKAGHLGTLDPSATGVLPLVLGRATRLARFFQGADKEYVAKIRLGMETDTYDRAGKVVAERPVPNLSRPEAEAVLEQFRGRIRQLPPMFSAVKVDGERLYRAARRQEERTRPERTVTIHQLQLLDLQSQVWQLRIHCSSGTYIRSLAHDIGHLLGTGSYVEELRRTRVGPFDLSLAIPVEEIPASWEDALIPLEELLLHFPSLCLERAQALRVKHGNPVPSEKHREGQYYRLVHDSQLLAIGLVRNGQIHPQVVLSPVQPEKS